MDFEKEGISIRIEWDLKILIFKFWILQLTGRGGEFGLDQKCQILYFFLIESFLPLRLLIWAWNFYFICFEKFLVGGGDGYTYDYSVSLSPNIWIMTFDLDLDFDLGLTIVSAFGSDRFTQIVKCHLFYTGVI